MNLNIAAAKIVLGEFDCDEIIQISNNALDKEYSDSLYGLASSRNLRTEEASELLRKAFEELHIRWPSKEEAIKLLIEFHLFRIDQGHFDPRNEIRSLINDVLIPSKVLEANDQYVGDKLNLERILGAFYSYEDIEENPNNVGYSGKYGTDAIKEIDQDIIVESRLWLKRHSQTEGNYREDHL